jgi:hypothetical protein
MRYVITATLIDTQAERINLWYLRLADEARFVGPGRVEFITTQPEALAEALIADPAMRGYTEPMPEAEYQAKVDRTILLRQQGRI